MRILKLFRLHGTKCLYSPIRQQDFKLHGKFLIGIMFPQGINELYGPAGLETILEKNAFMYNLLQDNFHLLTSCLSDSSSIRFTWRKICSRIPIEKSSFTKWDYFDSGEILNIITLLQLLTAASNVNIRISFTLYPVILVINRQSRRLCIRAPFLQGCRCFQGFIFSFDTFRLR